MSTFTKTGPPWSFEGVLKATREMQEAADTARVSLLHGLAHSGIPVIPHPMAERGRPIWLAHPDDVAEMRRLFGTQD